MIPATQVSLVHSALESEARLRVPTEAFKGTEAACGRHCELVHQCWTLGTNRKAPHSIPSRTELRRSM